MRRHGTALAVAMLAVVLGAGCQNKQGEQELRGGFGALEQKDYDKALASAEKYLKDNPGGPGSAEAIYLKGRSLASRTYANEAAANAGMAEARQAFTSALELQP